MTKRVSRKPMKDFEVISDIKKIKLLLESTRRTIVFTYLVHTPMTVKQLADAMGKKPGTVLHHVQKLKEAGIIVLDYTRETPTGIVERYYRATARDYRLGISEMMGATAGSDKAVKDRAFSILTGLSTYDFNIPESDLQEAIEILRSMLAIEDQIRKRVPYPRSEEFIRLAPSVKSDLTRIAMQYFLQQDSEYRSLLDRWHRLLASSN